MSAIGNKADPSHPPLPTIKITASPRSPQIPRLSREPRIARTNSQSKPPKRTSTEKSFRAMQIEKELKFSRNQPQGHLQNSFVSETNPPSFFAPPFQESTQTIQKVKSYSREKNFRGSLKIQNPNKPFDVLSGISGSNIRKGQQYYAYWKAKAHEYLESNMKLMGDIRKLNQENQDLKEQVSKLKRKDMAIPQPLTLRTPIRIEDQTSRSEKSIRDFEPDNELRKLSLHYISKIEVMEKELKKKEIIISQYQDKITELSHRVAGDNERVRLMGRMKQEIERLQDSKLKQYEIPEERFSQNTSYATLQMNSPTKKLTKPQALGSYNDLPMSHIYSQVTQKNSLTPRRP